MALHPNPSAWWRLGRNQTFVAGWNTVTWQNLKGERMSGASLVVETCAVIRTIKQFPYLAGCLWLEVFWCSTCWILRRGQWRWCHQSRRLWVAWEPRAVGSGYIYISLVGFRVVKSLWVPRRAQVPQRVPEGALPGQLGQLKYIVLRLSLPRQPNYCIHDSQSRLKKTADAKPILSDGLHVALSPKWLCQKR